MLALTAIIVAIFTSSGEIDVALDTVHAPKTTANFLAYVRRGFFDGGTFFRTVTTHPDNQPGKPAGVKIDVIQATHNAKAHPKLDPPIDFESTAQTGIQHRDGTISMARDDSLKSAQTDFFICIGAQPSLDDGGLRSKDHRGFAAFGRVVHGMNVVRAIHAGPAKGQALTPPVAIVRVRVTNS
jgi:peptidyl-prolyl cis-trans isomerase A (cyclophilin A)